VSAASSLLLPESDLHEQFTLRSRTEIVALLREISRCRVPVTIYFGNGGQFMVSSLLAVNDAANTLIFDCGATPVVTDALVRARRFTMVTRLHNVKVQFVGNGAEKTVLDGLPALCAELPDAVQRFQRREYFRTVPAGKPLVCRITTPKRERFETRVIDIGCGGLSLLAPINCAPVDVGTRLGPCNLELPRTGPLEMALDVRDRKDIDLPSGARQQRLGCAFNGLRGTLLAAIQRYVNEQERARLAP
jgi:c-di-GMP-binding flagellar brake protein YcgR